ncbi:bifunctional diguanylate cyclase/phosphodiesterase [Acidithiobacillus sp.]|uniref:putative bifunctional diguanylate cyclase/phosphodiesterase n=1 Tax=Acidithiobacillus sp. TaxID=1872118 RepID=UPI00262E9E53|nr:bifunctional diguanylate cyclase/phosphodiesterase [Acidithiobacillus sp.]MDD2748836.1 bifunctional diguanylate cyclase/phosphodiesterase [Acidithiobacillus sp.]MDD5280655.1 bifunctional diguanylate cyclase/phosphodiesterase [Acidithiobacillus sp.]
MPNQIKNVTAIERDHSALFSAMLQALSAVPADAGAYGFLNALCQGILDNNRSLKWAWYAFQAPGKPLRPYHELGIQNHPDILENPQDPCYQVLSSNTAMTYSLDNPDCPEWLLPLRKQLSEIILVPFSIEGQKALGVVGSSESGYFEQVGTEFFSAFAYMGEMIISLQQHARRDPLTGLYNRMELDDRLEQALRMADQHQRLLAVAMLDLDNFKEINEKLGRLAGDQILVEFSQRIQKDLRSHDTLFRMGGDEFVLLIENLERWADLEVVMERIRMNLDRAFTVNQSELRVQASIGVTVYPLDDDKPRDIIHHANLALHQAKRHKTAQFYTLYDPSSIYDPGTPQLVARQQHFRGLLAEHVVTLYQPIIHTPSSRTHELEALARLEENGTLLETSEFLPWLAAEDRRKLSCTILEQAARQWRLWQNAGQSISIAVNFEPQDLLLEEVIQFIESTLLRFQMPAGQLIIEVLEGDEFLDYASAKAQLGRLKELGVRIALDDLGTAYASLLRLKDYPFDAVKLDQAFSRHLEKRPRDLHFLASMLEMANGLGVELIVEGIENAEVFSAVTALGIRQVQGYAISRPVSAGEISQRFLGKQISMQSSNSSLLVSFARFLVLAKGLRAVLQSMPQSINVQLSCDNLSCPLYPLMDTIPSLREQRAQLQLVIADIVGNHLSSEYSMEIYDHLTAGILNEMAAYIAATP